MKHYHALLILSVFIFFTGCTNIKTNVIQLPPPTAKLRVLVIVLSDYTNFKGVYNISPEEATKRTYNGVSIFLQRTGIYEVIPENEVKTALDNRDCNFSQWKFNNYSLVKELGNALYADYAFIHERSLAFLPTILWKQCIISFSSGMVYEASDSKIITDRFKTFTEESPEMKALFLKVSTAARADMLATAIRKGRIPGVIKEKPQTLPDRQDISTPVKELKEKRETVPEIEPIFTDNKSDTNLAATRKNITAEQAKESKDKPPKVIKEEAEKELARRMPLIKDSKDNKLVVYDFDSTAQFNIASLILSEALREELFKLGKFNLVNREDLTKAMGELQLQQSGFIDQKEKVKLGKWLAANQSVTGRFFELGKSLILQTRLTEIETMKIKSMASIKSEQGKEEELLNSMEALALKLADISAK